MAEEKIVEEFAQLHKSASRSKTARLRDLYEHIESLRSRGFSHATIVEAMRKHGLKFDLKSFEVTFYRIRKERTKRPAQSEEIPSKANSKELNNIETKAAESADKTSIPKTQRAAKQVTQEELKAIARSNIDINQFLE